MNEDSFPFIQGEGWDGGGVTAIAPIPTLARCSASSVPLPLKGRKPNK